MEDVPMKIEMVRVETLIPAIYNPRQMTEKQAADLEESIKRFGLCDPIIVNAHPDRLNVVIGGHQRLRIAQKMGMATVPVVFVELQIEKEQELNLRLNKNNGQWDWDALANFEQSVLEDVGFSKEELQKAFDVDVKEDDFDGELGSGEAITKLGDLYRLGEHRLLCGDSTKKEDVARIMDGKKADCVFTDPPYNVDYKYDKYEAIGGGRTQKFKDGGHIFNDDKTPEEFFEFLKNVFACVYEFSTDAAPLYVCHATKTQAQFFDALKINGWHFSQTIIWLKERIILAMGQDYHRVYEPIWFGWKKGNKHYSNHSITTEKEVWDLDRIEIEERLDVWYESRDKSSEYIHPTQKPIRLSGRAIKKSSQIGGLLYEPFGGSGSTMLACEQLQRRCYTMELDPKYCDAIVKRWETLTGKKAEKIQ